jgi:hypothetical protein
LLELLQGGGLQGQGAAVEVKGTGEGFAHRHGLAEAGDIQGGG